MTDTDFDYDDEQDEDEQGSQDPEWLRNLRREAKTGKKAQKRLNDLEAQLKSYERRDALREAGLNLNDTQRKLLERGYEGEWTPDGVRQFAIEAGWAQPAEPDVPEQEVQAIQRMASAAVGAGEAAPNEDFFAKLEGAQTEQEAMAIIEAQGLPTSWNSQ